VASFVHNKIIIEKHIYTHVIPVSTDTSVAIHFHLILKANSVLLINGMYYRYLRRPASIRKQWRVSWILKAPPHVPLAAQQQSLGSCSIARPAGGSPHSGWQADRDRGGMVYI
jgi:hypothetical protein